MKSVLLAVALTIPSLAAAQDACLRQAVDPNALGDGLQGQLVLSTLSGDGKAETRVLSGRDGANAPLEGDEGFRLASITKTYVAATVLRLWEDGRIDLDAPITQWLSPAWQATLAGDGYAPGRITVRHLLSHTSGMADHAQTDRFIETITSDPATEWTRARDVASLVAWTDPVGKPGGKFSYSDTGYILLGAIVEEITGQDLPDAVREQLGFDRLGLDGTYWERYELAGERERAHQVFDGRDTYDWNPSMDLYGGGGLVAPTADVARFFDALLEGRVFARARTLRTMLSADGLPPDSPYRLGVFDYDLRDGVHAIGHSGFWGTLVMRDPVSGRTIAGATTDVAGYRKLKAAMEDYVRMASKPEGDPAGCRAASGEAEQG